MLYQVRLRMKKKKVFIKRFLGLVNRNIKYEKEKTAGINKIHIVAETGKFEQQKMRSTDARIRKPEWMKKNSEEEEKKNEEIVLTCLFNDVRVNETRIR